MLAPFLHIHLDRIALNAAILSEQAGGTLVTPVIKADAYGLGAGPVAAALYDAGMRIFYVAHVEEAVLVRQYLQDYQKDQAEIRVLHGYETEAKEAFQNFNLQPVLSTCAQIKSYRQDFDPISLVVHVDTGMNRLGLQAKDLESLPSLLQGIKTWTMISHLVSAEDEHQSINQQQQELFQTYVEQFNPNYASLANSSGVFLGPAYHYDFLRPGIALYGGNPRANYVNPMQQVVTWYSPILQIAQVPEGQSLGYNQLYWTKKVRRIATLALGYADGYPRFVNQSHISFGGYAAPLVARVAMDMILIDISDSCFDSLRVGDLGIVMGDGGMSLDDLACLAGTIPYHILTGLGKRMKRVYAG